MPKRTKVLYPLFFIIFLVTLLFFPIINVYAVQDEYGNHLWTSETYQNSILLNSFNNSTYSEDMNITVSNYLWDNFEFIIQTRLNTTALGNLGYVSTYQGVGIQIYDEDLNLIYASGIAPNPSRLYDPLPFEMITSTSEIIELDIYRTINYVNVTLWHNYEMTGDYGDYEVTENWNFNLVAENYGEEEEEEPMMFGDLYFLGFILCLFICPLSVVGTIRMRNPKLLSITVFSFIGLISCFYILMNINPFGG